MDDKDAKIEKLERENAYLRGEVNRIEKQIQTNLMQVEMLKQRLEMLLKGHSSN